MKEFIEIMRMTVPPLIVAGVAYFIINRFLERQDRISLYKMKTEGKKIITPIRLQAFERIVLLLERISPAGLVVRLNQPDMNARQLHTELLRTIRNEFDHNVTQQVYVSTQTWEAVKNSKEETIKLINFAASKCGDHASGLDLSKMILEMTTKVEILPTQVAINIMKEEAKLLF